MSIDRLYDRLPLPIVQVLRDVAEWRADVLNHRDECAISALRHLAESADELDKWEGDMERTDRVTLAQPNVPISDYHKRHSYSESTRPKLRIVPVEREPTEPKE